MDSIRWKMNDFKDQGQCRNPKSICKGSPPLDFHRSLPGYAETPLQRLKNLAAFLGVQDILVKDESFRFGLNSFKVLGSSYALARFFAKELNTAANYSELQRKVLQLPKRTFSSATAGNHGSGLAWAAKQFGQEAAIFLPKGSSPGRLQKLLELGAKAEIVYLNYDDAVRFVSRLSRERGWIHVQDTSWNDYVEVPDLIMEGYLTIVAEYVEQLKDLGAEPPTHVILQAGVGSFAAAVAKGLRDYCEGPITIIVAEPIQADAFYQSACSRDGNPRRASGNLATHMAGLACAETNPVAWNILKNLSDCFVVCEDTVSAKGMRILGNPLGDDPRIISGGSGAVPLGVLYEAARNPSLAALKKSLGIDSGSRFLLISTEGATDKEDYLNVCWEG